MTAAGTRFVLPWLLACACACARAAPAPVVDEWARPQPDLSVPTEFPRHRLVAEDEIVRGPDHPGLKLLQGKVPLLYAFETSGMGHFDQATDPELSFAVFDEGTVAFEGQRCVKSGGVTLRRLQPAELAAFRQHLAEECRRLPPANPGDCSHGGTIHIGCRVGDRLVERTDRCHWFAATGPLNTFRDRLLTRLGLSGLVGEPAERKACRLGAAVLGGGEIGRTIMPSKTTNRVYVPR